MAVETDTDRSFMLADFGVTATYTPLGGSAVSIVGIKDNVYLDVNVGTAGVASSEPRFITRTSDVSSAQEGDAISIGGVDYIITVVMDDGTGITELALEEQ
tara:strand:- start:3971 stop:4273 length:303 start_codon:yes stop_codon:yes gene_type:complete